jgi:hypothetical protein
MLVMIAGTFKARDLRRDPRLVLNSPVTDPADPRAEFKLRGRAVDTDDEDLREATANAIEATSGWRPPGALALLLHRDPGGGSHRLGARRDGYDALESWCGDPARAPACRRSWQAMTFARAVR